MLKIFQGDRELRTWVIVIATILITSTLTTLTIYAVVPSLFGFSQSSDTLRFYKPEVLSADQVGYASIYLGAWAPKHPTNNAIINAIFYFQYLTPNDTSTIRFGFSVGPIGRVGGSLIDQGLASESRTDYSQSKVYVSSLPTPNFDNYTIHLWFYNNYQNAQDTADTSFPPVPIPVYVKEVNVILQIVDGLAPS